MPRNFEREISEALSTLVTLLPTDAVAVAAAASNGSHGSQGDLLGKSLEFQAALVADLVYARKFDDKATWNRCVGVYLAVWTDIKTGTAFSETVRSHYQAVDQAGHECIVLLSRCSNLSH